MRNSGFAAFTLVFALSNGLSFSSGRAAKQKQDTPALIRALDRREFDAAKTLIENGANPNSKNPQGQSALMYAAFRNRPDLVELLLAKGARVDDKDNEGFSALLDAIQENLPEVARILLKHGADPNVFVPKGDLSPISVAASRGKFELIKLLLDNGARIDTAGRRDDTPLMTALRKGNLLLVDLLITRGAGLNVKNKDGETAFMLAARLGMLDLLKQMLDKGADVRAADRDGRTALMYAIEGGQTACLTVLFEAGANPLAKDALGRTAVMLAQGESSQEIIDVLSKKGVDINAQDKYGCTALMRASQRNDIPVIRALLNHSADTNSRDKFGRTAVQRALAVRSLQACNALGSAGVEVSPAQRVEFLKHVIRSSVNRLEFSSAKFRDQVGGTCFSCHNQSMAQIALRAAKDRGFAVNAKNISLDKAVVYGEYFKCAEPMAKSVSAGKRLADEELNKHFPGAASHIGYGLFGIAAWDQKPDSSTDAVTRYLALIQEKDGHWRTQCQVRAPAENSIFTETALSIFSLRNFVKPQNAASVEPAILKGRAWLAKMDPKTTEDKSFHLFGLVWSGLSKGDPVVRKAVETLLKDQRDDGGWAQETGMKSDAYATGEVLAALHRAAGLSTADPAYQKGLDFLLRTVEEDGSWFVRSRTVPFQGYIDTGFPYRQDQFISITASCWATVALADALPVARANTALK